MLVSAEESRRSVLNPDFDMKFSRHQLACIIKDAKPDRFSLPSETSLAACGKRT